MKTLIILLVLAGVASAQSIPKNQRDALNGANDQAPSGRNRFVCDLDPRLLQTGLGTVVIQKDGVTVGTASAVNFEGSGVLSVTQPPTSSTATAVFDSGGGAGGSGGAHEHFEGINVVCTDSSTIDVTLTSPVLADDSFIAYAPGDYYLVGTGSSNVKTDDGSNFAASTWYFGYLESDGSSTTYIRFSQSPTKPASALRFYGLFTAVYNRNSGATASFRTYSQCDRDVRYYYAIRMLSNGSATSYTGVGITTTQIPSSVSSVRRCVSVELEAIVTTSGGVYGTLGVRPYGGEASAGYSGQEPIWLDTYSVNEVIGSIALAKNNTDVQYIGTGSPHAYIDVLGFKLLLGRMP